MSHAALAKDGSEEAEGGGMGCSSTRTGVGDEGSRCCPRVVLFAGRTAPDFVPNHESCARRVEGRSDGEGTKAPRQNLAANKESFKSLGSSWETRVVWSGCSASTTSASYHVSSTILPARSISSHRASPFPSPKPPAFSNTSTKAFLTDVGMFLELL